METEIYEFSPLEKFQTPHKKLIKIHQNNCKEERTLKLEG
jgi:hypothetical protein